MERGERDKGRGGGRRGIREGCGDKGREGERV